MLAAGGAQRHVHVVVEGVHDDDASGAIRVDGGDGLNAGVVGVSVAACAAEHGGAARHELAELGHHVVRSLERVAAVVNCHQTFAVGAAAFGEMRAVGRVGAQSPRHYTRSPVLERADGEVGGVVPDTSLRGVAFGHVLRDAGVAVMERGENAPVEAVSVTMPCYGVDVLSCSADDGLGV